MDEFGKLLIVGFRAGAAANRTRGIIIGIRNRHLGGAGEIAGSGELNATNGLRVDGKSVFAGHRAIHNDGSGRTGGMAEIR